MVVAVVVLCTLSMLLTELMLQQDKQSPKLTTFASFIFVVLSTSLGTKGGIGTLVNDRRIPMGYHALLVGSATAYIVLREFAPE